MSKNFNATTQTQTRFPWRHWTDIGRPSDLPGEPADAPDDIDLLCSALIGAVEWVVRDDVNGGVKSCHWAAQNQATLDLGGTPATRRRPVSWAHVDAALKALGIIHLPDYYVYVHLEAGRLVPILDQFRPPDDGIWAIYPLNRHLSPKLRLLLDHLGQGLS